MLSSTSPTSWLDTQLTVLKQRQSYLNILYLLVAFPTGLAYFVFLTTGIVLGIGTLVIWLGVPILLFMILSWRQLALFERSLTHSWLHVDIPPLTLIQQGKQPFWSWLGSHLRSRITWKTLGYLFLKFPFGIFAFILTLTGLVLTLALLIIALTLGAIASPFVFLFDVRTKSAISHNHLFFLHCLGVAVFPIALLNGIAWLWSQFAWTMLGMSDQERQLAEARLLVEQEKARAERAEQRRQELIINVSHELRTPIASIRGHVEALLKQYDENASAATTSTTIRPYLTIIHRESIRLGMLFDELLALARTETSELHMNITEVDVKAVVEEVYQTIMPLARRERQITLICDVPATIGPARADHQRLQQALLNLVRNAITYTPDGGIVSIVLRQADTERLVLSVSDTGIGISEEDLQRIFERFYRTDMSRSRTTGGFGLGLAIVQDFVNAMGGTITVESVEGEGSCFRVFLPLAATGSTIR